MGYFREADPGASFPPFAVLREQFGFVPNLFRAQTLLPRVIEAETALAHAVLFQDQALSRVQKERILLTVAAAQRNVYCVTLHHQTLCLYGVSESLADAALLSFALKLGSNESPITRADVAALLAEGLTDESILEAILVTGLATFLCTLATGVGATPEFEPRPIPASGPSPAPPFAPDEHSGPYLRAIDRPPYEFAPFAFFLEKFGFVPSMFRAQTLRPDIIEAEAGAIRAVLFTEDVLSRTQKECILQSRSNADRALLDFALKLTPDPAGFSAEDLESLRRQNFTEEQILEAVVMTAFTNFLNTVQMGLGTEPDFVARQLALKTPHLLPSDLRPTEEALPSDPDFEYVAKVRGGELDAFEELINRHSRRVYRTLVGVLGDPDEAQDAMQDTFLKAFQHLADFQRRSKFSTWLVSIASNTGLQRLRERKNLESLDEDGDEGFRPRQIRAWTDNPEQAYAKTEVRTLVENTVMKLPAKYRVVLVLRDIEQLSIEEAAAALGLGIPALKARLLRGRLMLREALSPHFTKSAKGVSF